MNNIYQNTTQKTPPHREKTWTTQLLLESPKNKNFQSPDLEIHEQNHILLTVLQGSKSIQYILNFHFSKFQAN